MKKQEFKITVHFANGHKMPSRFTGTKTEIETYYAQGRLFNLTMGGNKNLQPVTKVEYHA